MCVKLVHVHQPSDVEHECHKPPYVESSKENEEEEGKSGEPVEISIWCLKPMIDFALTWRRIGRQLRQTSG